MSVSKLLLDDGPNGDLPSAGIDRKGDNGTGCACGKEASRMAGKTIPLRLPTNSELKTDAKVVEAMGTNADSGTTCDISFDCACANSEDEVVEVEPPPRKQ